jgi:hypothetical protein
MLGINYSKHICTTNKIKMQYKRKHDRSTHKISARYMHKTIAPNTRLQNSGRKKLTIENIDTLIITLKSN